MRENRRLENLTIEDARIIYRNFSGRQAQFNPAGARNFCVVLPTEELADQLAADGWNVKTRVARDEGEDDMHYIKVSVRFDKFPPNITMLTRKNKIKVDEEMVDELDSAEIIGVDLTINPSCYPAKGTTPAGVKAYLKTMYITVERDELVEKYADYDR